MALDVVACPLKILVATSNLWAVAVLTFGLCSATATAMAADYATNATKEYRKPLKELCQNMARNIKLVLGVTIVMSVLNYGVAISCFYCNSANNSACLDFSKMDGETLAKLVPIVHCETAIPSPVAQDFFCRKIVQMIFHSDRNSELRVTRGCGWVPNRSPQDCYRADSSDHLETVCQCFTDQCNSADDVNPTGAAVLFLSLTTVMLFYR